LAATRRCLEDGHRFCAGTTTIKKKKGSNQTKTIVKHHKACASEFDYQGWKAWGEWRRQYLAVAKYEDDERTGKSSKCAGAKRDCWNICDYPSECRWEQQIVLGPLSLGDVPELVYAVSPGTVSELPSPVSPEEEQTPPRLTDYGALLQRVELE
jgi:hypothetical protein